jgi:hypothetical protein
VNWCPAASEAYEPDGEIPGNPEANPTARKLRAPKVDRAARKLGEVEGKPAARELGAPEVDRATGK